MCQGWLDSMHVVHDDAKEKDFQLEISWICEESKGVHEFIPQDLFDQAEAAAKAALNNDMEEDD